MNVLIIGNAEETERFVRRFPELRILENGGDEDLIVCFPGGKLPNNGIKCPVLTDVTYSSLSEWNNGQHELSLLIGFSSLPTFLERDILEISLFRNEMLSDTGILMEKLKTDFRIVKDQTALVSPRVIAMIINEAFMTAEDGTASREDIDTAMKLGTNYPLGPFEWAEKIGIQCVFNLLSALYKETGDVRYLPSELLANEAAH